MPDIYTSELAERKGYFKKRKSAVFLFTYFSALASEKEDISKCLPLSYAKKKKNIITKR